MLKYSIALIIIIFGFYFTVSSQTTDKVVVSYVVDGDTIRAKINGELEYVRIIGINSPELDDERPLVKCFAQASKKKAIELLDTKEITLEADPTQNDRDRYKRLLRYVYIDGKNFSLWMIENGFANEYTYSKPYKYQTEFKEAEKKARDSEKGLWGSTCG